MSTKTTFKRIALVTVAALGFGMMSTVVAVAATTLTPLATSGVSTDVSSITLIPANTASIAATDYGVFEVSLANSDGIAAPLQIGESLTATVISTPTNGRAGVASANNGTGVNVAADITLKWSVDYSPTTRVITTPSATGTPSTMFAETAQSSLGGAYDDMSLSANLHGGTDLTTGGYTASTSTATATYALGVYATADQDLLDAGYYTIRIRVLNTAGNTVSFQDVKFKVSTAANSGAVLTAAVTGSFPTPTAAGLIQFSPTQKMSATLVDANGGRVVTASNGAPTVSAVVKDKGSSATPAVYTSDSLTLTDTGTAYTVALDTAGVTVDDIVGDGVYYATQGVLTGLAGTGTLTVRYGDAVATASVVMTGTTASQWMNTSVSATGKVAKTVATNYDLPLTTKAASITATAYSAADATASTTTGVASAIMYYTLSYSGCVLGDMSPAATTALTKVTANANGQYTIDITNANPIDSCSATVVFSGATLVTTPTTGSLTRVINWSKPVPTSVVTSPAGDYLAVPGSTHKFTWTITDQFSAPIVGSTVQFSMSGANKPATGSSVPSAITDANGQVSYTFTDAAGVPASATLGSTTVGLSSVGTTSFAQGARTITYKATITAIASLYATYTSTNLAGTVVTGVVPTTNIGGTTGVPVSTADQLDTTKVLTGTSAAPYVALNFTAKTAAAVATAGVPTTVTVTGAKLIGSDGKLGTSVTVYANENVYILGTTAGVATVTAVNGTLTSTATINFVNVAADARIITATEAAGLVTATVKDAFGNGVAGVSVDATGSGGAWLGNGSTSSTFTTSTDGTVSFAVTGAGSVKVSLSSTTYAKASFLAGAGNATGTVVTTGAPAGVRSATVSTSGTTQATDVAQTAADAAAEATDAENAATDAANAAAEAADAATAAAQDAADAVAALSAQVADLISGLKAQLTALTNLVIKIQKKVKA